ncbi:MAG TPA: GNAT family N-acetyltransferase [Gemmatimonadaceae bacterium]
MSICTFDLPGDVPNAFVAVPHAVYADDPHWIPEDPGAVRRAFAVDHDWFENGSAAGFYIPDRARLAVFRRDSFEVDGRPAAFFGYWDQAGAGNETAELLREAEVWAIDAGAEVLYGPVDFNTSRRYRVRVSAESDAATFLGEPYNPHHYPKLLENAGYHVVRRYLSQIGTRRPIRVAPKERVRDGVIAAGYQLETLDSEKWRENILQLKQLADAVFAENFAFAPETLVTFVRGYGEGVAKRLDPRTSLLVRGIEGDIVGFVLIYPQYAPLVAQSAGGARIDAAELSFEEHWPTLERAGELTAIVRTIGVHPAHRARGVMDALMAEAVARGTRYYDRWIGALIDESNWSRRFGASQTDHERAYALYAKELRAPAPS